MISSNTYTSAQSVPAQCHHLHKHICSGRHKTEFYCSRTGRRQERGLFYFFSTDNQQQHGAENAITSSLHSIIYLPSSFSSVVNYLRVVIANGTFGKTHYHHLLNRKITSYLSSLDGV